MLSPSGGSGHDAPASYADHIVTGGEDPIAAAEEARGRLSWCESQEQILSNVPNGKVHVRRDIVSIWSFYS